jgi:hypothetical protein
MNHDAETGTGGREDVQARGPAADRSGRPAVEPGPARLRGAPPEELQTAPEGDAPDLAGINPGEGPGQTPGE